MNKKHEHIQAAVMYEIEQALEKLERRGVGYIDASYPGSIDYKIDGVCYTIKISEEDAQ